MTELRITVIATIRGHAPDIKEYAKRLHRDIEEALTNPDGPDINVLALEISKKMEGYENLTSSPSEGG